jgi:translation initiation factor IF-3
VPVPRRLDRRPPEQDLTRINERINVPEVRLIDEEGQQVGVLKTADALRFARERDLDLVEVAPQARPPVCRVLDYSKYKYEQAQKQKQARKHQQQITVREIKFRPKIAQHDYDTKKGHVSRFLLSKFKVKVTIMFRGREVSHPERGVAILDRLAEELTDVAVVEQSPTLDGRNMAMLLAPSKAVLNGQIGSAQAQGAAARAPDGAQPVAVGAPDGTEGEAAGAAAEDASGAAATAERAPDEKTPDAVKDPDAKQDQEAETEAAAQGADTQGADKNGAPGAQEGEGEAVAAGDQKPARRGQRSAKVAAQGGQGEGAESTKPAAASNTGQEEKKPKAAARGKGASPPGSRTPTAAA